MVMDCETCEYYEDDYVEREAYGMTMMIKGEWCHKTGEAVRFNSLSVEDCQDYKELG